MSLIIAKNHEAVSELVEPDMAKWAIYQLSHNRESFSKYLVDQSIDHILNLLGNNSKRLNEKIANTLYI